MRSTLIRFGLCLMVLWHLGCGAATQQSVLVRFLDDSPARGGTDWCQGKGIEQEANASTHQYLPQTFTIHAWRNETVDAGKTVNENTVLQALEEGKLGFTLLVAPPGQGKTRFAEAIEARLCGSMPILRLDVASQYLDSLDKMKDDAVYSQLTRQLELTEEEKQQEFRQLTDKARWVLVVDSLHEVPRARRDAVVHNLRSFVDRHSRHLQIIVLARPDVLVADPGLGPFDTLLEIPVMDVARAQEAVTALLAGSSARFWQWIQYFDVDAPETTTQGNLYHLLTTFRNVQSLVQVARQMKVFGSDAEFAQAKAQAPAVVLEAVAQELIRYDLGKAKTTPAVGMQILDTMLLQSSDGKLAVDLDVEVGTCQRAAGSMKVPEFAEVCRHLLDTGLFRRSPNQALWRMASQPMEDLLRARGVAREIDAQGCSAVAQLAGAVARHKTAQILVGIPSGSKCLTEVTRVVCGQGDAKQAAERLSPGLAGGATRAALIQPLRSAPEGCVKEVADLLGK